MWLMIGLVAAVFAAIAWSRRVSRKKGSHLVASSFREPGAPLKDAAERPYAPQILEVEPQHFVGDAEIDVSRAETLAVPAASAAQDDSSTDAGESRYVELARLNSDVSKGWRFSATMQLRTPLRILEMHGAVRLFSEGDPPQVAPHEGAWTPALNSFHEMGIDLPELQMDRQMASDIGPIPVDGGEYLKFLKEVRAIVERPVETADLQVMLRAELGKDEWSEIVNRLGGTERVESSFFTPFIEAIPKLTDAIVDELFSLDLVTPAKLAAASDHLLLAIKGVGPAKLQSIRWACDQADDMNSEWVAWAKR